MGERRSDTRMRGGFFNRGNEIGYNCFNCGFKFRASDNQELPFKAVKFLTTWCYYQNRNQPVALFGTAGEPNKFIS